MIEVKEFYDLIFANTGLKRNNLSESCAKLANKHADELANKVALGFVEYLKEHKHSTLSIKEDLYQFRKKENL
jgi:hypothetical protein